MNFTRIREKQKPLCLLDVYFCLAWYIRQVIRGKKEGRKGRLGGDDKTERYMCMYRYRYICIHIHTYVYTYTAVVIYRYLRMCQSICN